MLNNIKQDKKAPKQIAWCHTLQTQQHGITASLKIPWPWISHRTCKTERKTAEGHVETAAQIQSLREMCFSQET